MINRIQQLAKRNGYHQVRAKSKEELTELIEAIDENIEPHIIDEIADTMIMCFQLMEVYGFENDVYDRIDYKVERQEKRFEEVE